MRALQPEPARHLDPKVQSLLREVSHALLGAIGESATVLQTLRQLHRHGYTLHLLLDCERDVVAGASRGGPRAPEPTFRIDANDLAFLRSIGIDPPRRRRRPRPSAAPEDPDAPGATDHSDLSEPRD